MRLKPTVFPSLLAENKSRLSIFSKLCLCIFHWASAGREGQDFGWQHWLMSASPIALSPWLFDSSSVAAIFWRALTCDAQLFLLCAHSYLCIPSQFLLSLIFQYFFLLGPDKPSKTLPLPMYSYLRPLLGAFLVPSSATCHGILACLLHHPCAITFSKPPRASLAMC